MSNKSCDEPRIELNEFWLFRFQSFVEFKEFRMPCWESWINRSSTAGFKHLLHMKNLILSFQVVPVLDMLLKLQCELLKVGCYVLLIWEDQSCPISYVSGSE